MDKLPIAAAPDPAGNGAVITAVVARMASTRLPGKALQEVGGRPFMEILLRRLASANGLGRIVLCTSTRPENRALVELAQRLGVDWFAGSEENLLDRLLGALVRFGADHVLRVNGDNMLTDPGLAAAVVGHHLAAGADYTRCLGLPLGAAAEAMSRRMLEELARSLGSAADTEYLTVYAFDPDRFRCVVLLPPAAWHRPYYSLSTDTPQDLANLRRLWGQSSDRVLGPRLAEIVRLYDRDESLPRMAPEAPIKLPGRTCSYAEFLQWVNRLGSRCTRVALATGDGLSP